MSNHPPGPFLFDPLPDEPEAEADDRTDALSEHRDEPAEPSSIESTAEAGLDSREPAAIDAPLAGPPVKSVRPQQVLFEEPVEEAEVPELVPTAARRKRRPRDPGRVSPVARLTSGLLDLSASLAMALAALIGARILGVEPHVTLLPGIVLFVVVFSFIYHVFALLFWGRTPGMASADLVTRDASGQSITARQSALRWAGSLGTVLFAGVPMIVSWFTGWSLADLVSGSETKVEAG